MRSTPRALAMAVALASLSQAQNSSFDVLDFVDPFIGTANYGHVFAGASLPFGMAKAVADINDVNENQGGFATDSLDQLITGFSHMHDSGTGGSPSMGQFPIFPHPGCPADDVDQCAFRKADRAVGRVGDAVARPGYFAVTLNSSIKAEAAVTNHTALHRFTFLTNSTGAGNATDGGPVMLVDLTDLPESRMAGRITVNPDTGRIIANATFAPSFGFGAYTLFSCIDFSGGSVRDGGVWRELRGSTDFHEIEVLDDGLESSRYSVGAFVRFHPAQTITARAGLSFVSPEKACQNGETESPNFDFDGAVATAETAWREKMGVIQVDAAGVNDSLQTTFWSGVYRSLLSPQDYTGENPLWQSDEPYYDSYYCIWDSFRSIHPFITLVDPLSQSRMVRALVDIYKHEGWLPDCRMTLSKGWTQGGSNADIVIVESFLKGVQDVDWNLAYDAIVKDAEVEPMNWDFQGRGGLISWKSLGYIPTADFDPLGSGLMTRSISRTVEYGYDDFCISLMAEKLNKTADQEKYLKRSGAWKNMFNPEQTSTFTNGTDTGFVGFLQPRYLNGTFGFQDPLLCSPLLNMTGPCFLSQNNVETYEASAWLYTFFVPGDMASLITTLGGPAAFVRRLDFLHDSGILYIGDEQGFLPVFQYHHAGRPALSARRVHSYIPAQFNTSNNGLPGNDDSGAMGSFLALSMLGIFPNPGQDVYFITPPFFKEVSITSKQTGKTATIRNINFDPTYQATAIQSVRLNNKTYTRNWITHEFFLQGGLLELTLGRNESSWGTTEEDLPPSVGIA